MEGVSTVIIARDAAWVEAAALVISDESGMPCLAVAADLTDAAALSNAIAQSHSKLGHVHILVNNAGATPMGRIGDLDDATWMKSIGLKLTG